MLPTFVIGLREGLEAALIVGIVTAFLRQRGRLDLLRWAFAGVAAAIVLCLSIGIVLDIVSHELPQRQQEGLETVIGACAVAMVTYMVVWMRRHSRTLKAQLEGAAEHALAAGSGFALVVMAFLAVLREGLETVVFLLAAFNQSGNTALAATGALLGIVVAVILGWAIYRGGVRLNLSKFFRFTGIVLTFVAAGLVVSALHTAHEAGWLTIGQQSTVDLSALVRPGSVQAALLTGMLGVQPHPVVIEVIGWLVYVVPVGLYVAVPPAANGRRRLTSRRIQTGLIVSGALAAIAALVLVIVRPDRPTSPGAVKAANGATAKVVSVAGTQAVVEASVVHPGAANPVGGVTSLSTKQQGTQVIDGLVANVYTTTITGTVAGGPSTLSYTDLAARNGGRLPLGVRAGEGIAPVKQTSTDQLTVSIEPRTGRIIDLQWHETITLVATFSIGPTVIGAPQNSAWLLPTTTGSTAAAAARADRQALDRRDRFGALAIAGLVVAGLSFASTATIALASRRRRDSASAAAVVEPPVNRLAPQPVSPSSALLKG